MENKFTYKGADVKAYFTYTYHLSRGEIEIATAKILKLVVTPVPTDEDIASPALMRLFAGVMNQFMADCAAIDEIKKEQPVTPGSSVGVMVESPAGGK